MEYGPRIRDLTFDAGRQEATLAYLDAYKVDAYVVSGASLWDWLQALTAQLPVTLTAGDDGMYWMPWRWRAGWTDAIADVSVQRDGLTRKGRVVSLPYSPINAVTALYAPDRGSTFLGRISLQAEALAGDARVLPNSWAGASVRRLGATYAAEVPIPWTWDRTTAALVAEDTLVAQALPRRMWTGAVPPDLEGMREGSVVTLTDSDVGIAGELALVASLSPGPHPDVSYVLLDGPHTGRNRATA